MLVFFFFQAEDGIRDWSVTGVQTCALPICWWDVRPHPKFGTIELRVLDSQTNLRNTLALTALTQCLVAQVLEEAGPHEPYNMHLAVETKLRASRYGMDAAFYDVHDKITVPA